MEVTYDLSVLNHVRAFVLNLCTRHVKSRIALAADHVSQYMQSLQCGVSDHAMSYRYWKDCHHEGQAEEHGL